MSWPTFLPTAAGIMLQRNGDTEAAASQLAEFRALQSSSGGGQAAADPEVAEQAEALARAVAAAAAAGGG